MEPRIREESLSDGSKVYDVVVEARTFDDEGRSLKIEIRVGALDEVEAFEIRSRLRFASIDVELPAGYSLKKKERPCSTEDS